MLDLRKNGAGDLYSNEDHVARPTFSADQTGVEHVSCHVKWHSGISLVKEDAFDLCARQIQREHPVRSMKFHILIANKRNRFLDSCK